MKVWEGTTSIVEKWNVLRFALCDDAARFLGKACRSHSDWFKGNESLLLPLFERSGRILHNTNGLYHWIRA